MYSFDWGKEPDTKLVCVVKFEDGEEEHYTKQLALKLLSFTEYTLVGFTQEPAPPTLHDAVTWCKENYDDFRENLCGKYIDKEYELAFDALNSLIILRELYNEGWVPDWGDVDQEKYVIFSSNYELQKGLRFQENENLYFKSEEIRDKFFEEQISLLKEASILL